MAFLKSIHYTCVPNNITAISFLLYGFKRNVDTKRWNKIITTLPAAGDFCMSRKPRTNIINKTLVIYWEASSYYSSPVMPTAKSKTTYYNKRWRSSTWMFVILFVFSKTSSMYLTDEQQIKAMSLNFGLKKENLFHLGLFWLSFMIMMPVNNKA